jgi:hypothetical protein
MMNPTVLYLIGIITTFSFGIILWRMTDRDYTKSAENYWDMLYSRYYGGRVEFK